MLVRLKATEFEAVLFGGPSTINVMGPKGEQTAKPGDVILFHGELASDREVIKKSDFDEKYDVIDEDTTPPVESQEMKSGYHEYDIFTVTSSPTELYKVIKEDALPEDEAKYFSSVAAAEAWIETVSPTQTPDPGIAVDGDDPGVEATGELPVPTTEELD